MKWTPLIQGLLGAAFGILLLAKGEILGLEGIGVRVAGGIVLVLGACLAASCRGRRLPAP